MLKLSNIKHEGVSHFVVLVQDGYEVYRVGCTHSVRCAVIGWSGDKGLRRAIREVDKRDNNEGE